MMTQALFWEAVPRCLVTNKMLLKIKVKLVIKIMTAAEAFPHVSPKLIHPDTGGLVDMTRDELENADAPLVLEINQVHWLRYELLTVLEPREKEVTESVQNAFWEEKRLLFPEQQDGEVGERDREQQHTPM